MFESTADAALLLAVDCGNTRVHFGLFGDAGAIPHTHARSGDTAAAAASATGVPVPLDTWSLEVPFTVEACRDALNERLGADASARVRVACASVNPRATEPVAELAATDPRVTGYVLLGHDTPIPIDNRTDAPEQVGHDRLLNALAAATMFPGRACVVVDFGTAITFDVVSAAGAYEGGVILPGIRLTTRALYDHTAQLPLIESSSSEPAPRAIGRSTREAIRAGFQHGFPGMMRGVLAAVVAELGATDCAVVGTGGDIESLGAQLPELDAIVPDITLVGIRLAVERLARE